MDRFLALTPRQRLPFNLLAFACQESLTPDVPLHPADVARILVPHQTVWERNLSATITGAGTPVLLRTCYTSELKEAWISMRARCEISKDLGTEPCHVLDDCNLYSFGPHPNAWRAVLRRIPMLPAVSTWGTVEEDFDHYEECLRERQDIDSGDDTAWLEHASDIFTSVLYVADEEALRGGRVRMKWLDAHGICVWENWTTPESLAAIRGGLLDGNSPADYAEGDNFPNRNGNFER